MTIACTTPTPPRSADEVWREIQRGHPYPLSLQLVLTNRCHLSCPHCYIAAPTGPELLLSCSDYVRCFDEWADMGVLQLTFTGGEPGLRPDLIPIVQAAGERHFLVNLKTSATWMSPDDPGRLLDAGLSVLEVSLYEAEPERHDLFVGLQGAFEKTVFSADRFARLGGRVRVNIMAMNVNAEGIPALLDLCDAHGFDHVVDPVVVMGQDGNRSSMGLRMSSMQLSDLMALKAVNSLSLPETIPSRKDMSAPICGAGSGSAQIEPNGDVMLCDKLRFVLGNLRESSLATIWQQSSIRKKITQLQWRDLKECSTCGHAWACGHCPGEALSEFGDMLRAIPFECMVTRAMIRGR